MQPSFKLEGRARERVIGMLKCAARKSLEEQLQRAQGRARAQPTMQASSSVHVQVVFTPSWAAKFEEEVVASRRS